MTQKIYEQLPFIQKMSIATSFSLLLVLIRYLKTDTIQYLFLVWNLFLACIPYTITLLLDIRKTNRFVFWCSFCIWLSFLPNSPYIITDLQHLRSSTLQHVWFDVLLILSFAINGLILGFTSLQMMQKSIQQRFSKKISTISTYTILLLCGFGIYLGRVLRWNSWDLLQNPIKILSDISKRVLFPIEHIHTWVFTMGFGGFLIITYQLMDYYHKK